MHIKNEFRTYPLTLPSIGIAPFKLLGRIYVTTHWHQIRTKCTFTALNTRSKENSCLFYSFALSFVPPTRNALTRSKFTTESAYFIKSNCLASIDVLKPHSLAQNRTPNSTGRASPSYFTTRFRSSCSVLIGASVKALRLLVQNTTVRTFHWSTSCWQVGSWMGGWVGR